MSREWTPAARAALDGAKPQPALAPNAWERVRRVKQPPIPLWEGWRPIENAPGLIWLQHSRNREARWRARSDIVKRGYTPRSACLWNSTREPNEAERAEIAKTCQRMQTEMLDWSANPHATRKKVTYGRIYFIRQGPAVKIGFSQHVGRRLQFLQTCHHEELSLMADIPGAPQDEVTIHRKFAHLRIRGEWFRLETDLEQFIHEKMA